MRYLHTRLVTSKEFWSAIHELGAVYFARDDRTDMIKIGHSRDPWKRLSDLQVGNSNRLDLIGVIAASKEIEKLVHGNFPDGHARGEWFYDRGVISQWLMGMTQSEPMYRHIWRLVPGREFFCEWHEEIRFTYQALLGPRQAGMGSSSHESQRERRLLIRLMRVAWKPDLGLGFVLMLSILDVAR